MMAHQALLNAYCRATILLDLPLVPKEALEAGEDPEFVPVSSDDVRVRPLVVVDLCYLEQPPITTAVVARSGKCGRSALYENQPPFRLPSLRTILRTILIILGNYLKFKSD